MGALRNEVRGLDPSQPIYDIKTMETVIEESVSDRRFNMMLLGIFASVALVLAVIGIYSVMSHTVAQAMREIGIRMALGAQSADVLKLVVGQGLLLTATGILLGLGGAFALTRLIARLLFGITPTDPATFVTISICLLATALLACYLPARKATKVDPLIALRYE